MWACDGESNDENRKDRRVEGLHRSAQGENMWTIIMELWNQNRVSFFVIRDGKVFHNSANTRQIDKCYTFPNLEL